MWTRLEPLRDTLLSVLPYVRCILSVRIGRPALKPFLALTEEVHTVLYEKCIFRQSNRNMIDAGAGGGRVLE